MNLNTWYIDRKNTEAKRKYVIYKSTNTNLFLQDVIVEILFDCVFEMTTIESMSQIELADKIENEIISFIQNYNYYEYESVEEMKGD